ncbi:glycosyltransferase family protein [Peterkaempfera bronchialis]|uniref:Glycosyltransferase RgtA/B/C/D-like domain-containing protein n=1 Tax=Peterkaempfera bronchialis TaxID=2126346 RepID=A0A345SWL2_9ACTN|nr:hypothetical protein [Peterkaempfera bronchialis]AXI78117.1 hypothetical protein C7M71_012360 [Peterkaempfera bronchialis]
MKATSPPPAAALPQAEPGGASRLRRAPSPHAKGSRLKTALRAAAPALLGYASVRIIGIAVLAWWAQNRGADLGELLGRRWDSVWYLGIVQHGYDAAIPPPGAQGVSRSNLAFFPLYPAMVWVASHLLPLAASTAGLLISWAFSLAAAWGIFEVGRQLHDRRTGVVLAVLWGVLPHALTESMAYTEPVFTAFAAWSLSMALRRRWIAAALLSVLAGLTRPTGIALAGAISLAALVALWQHWRTRREVDAEPAPAPWRPLVAVVLAPLGWLAYVVWVGLRLHRVDGYFLVQSEWGSTFDGGVYTVDNVIQFFSKSPNTALVIAVIVGTLISSVVLFLLCILDRVPLPLLAYTAAALVITLGGAGFFHAKARFLIPVFPLLLPVARAIARARVSRAAVLLGTGAVLSAVYGGHLALIWTRSP